MSGRCWTGRCSSRPSTPTPSAGGLSSPCSGWYWPQVSHPYTLSLPVCNIIPCVDGVWDNWKYEDVSQFVLDVSCLEAVLHPAAATPYTGIQRVSASFLHRNMIYSKHNFGSQADNATCIILLLSDSPEFPF